MRLREHGLRVIYEPAAVVDHFEFGSEAGPGEAEATMLRNRFQFRKRHALALGSRHLPPSPANIVAARARLPAGTRRVLVMDNEVPLGALGAGYPRLRELLVEATRLGWSVTLFPLLQRSFDWAGVRAEIPPSIEVANDLGQARQAESLTGFLAERRDSFDVMLVSRPTNMATVRAVLQARPELLGRARLVYDAEALFSARDALKSGLDGKPLAEPEIDRLVDAEVALADAAVSIVCVNELEARFFRNRLPTPVHVLSHPVDTRALTDDFAARSGFLFVGRLLEKQSPNWMGLDWFIRETWPLIRASLSDATLTVAGWLHPDHAELEGPGIRLLGPVDDLGPLYAGARIFVAPVRFAAGVPIKIIEAAAAGLPTLATRLMARQLQWGDAEIVNLDGGAEMATAALRLHEDAAAWTTMRDRAAARVAEEHGRPRFVAALSATPARRRPAHRRRRPGRGRLHPGAATGPAVEGGCLAAAIRTAPPPPDAAPASGQHRTASAATCPPHRPP